MHCCEVKPLPEPSSNAKVTSGSTSLVRPKLPQTIYRKEVSSMLRLKINLRVRRSVRVKCPRHPRYNPERAIHGGCHYCVAIYELYAGKLARWKAIASGSSCASRGRDFNDCATRWSREQSTMLGILRGESPRAANRL